MDNEFQKDIELIDNEELESFNLQLFFKAVLARKRLFLFIFFASLFYTFVSTTYKYFFNPVYRGEFSLLISDPLKNEKVDQIGKLDQKDIISKLALNTTSNDITTLIEVLKSKNIIESIANKYKIPLRIFSKNLEIKIGGGSKRFERAEGILVVSLTGKNPNLTKRILEDLSNLYLETAIKQRQKKLSDGLMFLNEQEPALSTKTVEIQTKLEEFRIKNKLIEPIIESKILKDNQISFDKKIRTFLLERKRLEVLREQIINGNLIATSFKEDIMASADQNNVIRSNGLFFTDSDQGLLEQYSKLELMIAEASTKFRQDSKVIKSLKLKLNELKPLLIKSQLKAVDNALDINKINVQNIKSINNEISKEFLMKPSLIKEYETLQLRLNIASENLKALVAAREILQLEIAQNSFPWSIIENPSVSNRPVKPYVLRNLFLGFILSITGGLVGVFLRNLLDNVYHDASEISKSLRLPILTQIPYLENIYKDKNNFLSVKNQEASEENNSLEKNKKILFHESFRELYTSIRFLSNESQMKSILITSSIAEEGKSITSLMFAKTLIDFDKKVLLVDTNLRIPNLHSLIGSENKIGLSDILLDNSLNLQDVIQANAENNGLDFISAGQVFSNPSRLIDSSRFKEILESIKNFKKYDYLIFDSAPILGMTDTPLLACHCDFSLVIVSLDFVDKKLPIKSLSKIRKSKSPILGLIVNSINPSSELDLGKYSFNFYSSDTKLYGYKYFKKDNKEKEDKLSLEIENENNWLKTFKINFLLENLKRFFVWIDEK